MEEARGSLHFQNTAQEISLTHLCGGEALTGHAEYDIMVI